MQKDDDDKVTTGDDDVSDLGSDADDDSTTTGDHQIPTIPVVKEGTEEAGQFEEPIASPNVLGEESIAGDAPDGEPQDIDKSLADLGLENDEGGVKPLSSDDID